MFLQVTKHRQRNQSTNTAQKVFRDQITKKPENLNASAQQPHGLMKQTMTTSHAMSNMHPMLLEPSDFAPDYLHNEDFLVRTSDDEEDRVQEIFEDEDDIDEIPQATGHAFVVDDYDAHIKQQEKAEKMKRDRLIFLLNRSGMTIF
jgi:hypothetical protein